MNDNPKVPIAELSARMNKVISRHFKPSAAQLYVGEASQILDDYIEISLNNSNDSSSSIKNWAGAVKSQNGDVKYIVNRGYLSINLTTAEITRSLLKRLTGPLASMCRLSQKAREAKVRLSKKMTQHFASTAKERVRDYVISARNFRDRVKTDDPDQMSDVTVIYIHPGRYQVFDAQEQLWFEAAIKPVGKGTSTIEVEIIDAKFGNAAAFEGYLMAM